MDRNFIIMTDSDSDLPYDLKLQYNIPFVAMPYTLNGKEYYDDLGQTLDYADYYAAMRNGAAPTTAALNEENYLEYFEPYLQEGKDILFIAFSSQLSRTIISARSAREQLLEKYPERKLIIIDTLSISAPQTLLVLKAYALADKGWSIEEIAAWLEANKLRAQALFTVDDLKYLQRGGRISAVAATMGGLLDLKPIILEDREGKLNNVAKVRGRKKAINYLIDAAVENMEDGEELPVIILHADIKADAERVKDLLLQRKPGLQVRIDSVGPVIGAHCGPGTLAICFFGKERKQ